MLLVFLAKSLLRDTYDRERIVVENLFILYMCNYTYYICDLYYYIYMVYVICVSIGKYLKMIIIFGKIIAHIIVNNIPIQYSVK